MQHARCQKVFYTDAGGRITIDIDDAGYSSLNSLFSVTCTFCCQYNNSNMPDVMARAMTASGREWSPCTDEGRSSRPENWNWEPGIYVPR